jgi:hypothetical protein
MRNKNMVNTITRQPLIKYPLQTIDLKNKQ